jgi:hypothetical protein
LFKQFGFPILYQKQINKTMLQIAVTLLILLIVLGGLFAITLSRGEGKELKKSCGCSVPGTDGNEGSSCVSSCDS